MLFTTSVGCAIPKNSTHQARNSGSAESQPVKISGREFMIQTRRSIRHQKIKGSRFASDSLLYIRGPQ